MLDKIIFSVNFIKIIIVFKYYEMQKNYYINYYYFKILKILN